MSDDVMTHLAERGLTAPGSLLEVYEEQWPSAVRELVYRPGTPEGRPSMRWAEDLIGGSSWPLLPNLVPIMPVDERSFACVVVSDLGEEPLPGEGAVVRWHLDVRADEHQAALLDTDCHLYVASVADELAAREEGLRRVLDEIGPAYQETYLANEKRPRDFVVRPVRIACQNVIVALAAFAQDSSFDGLAVVAWQTCEVPHVGTHEANRALAALTLCDAFQSGGTMEIRFDRPASVQIHGARRSYPGHPERRVPASLRRYGRTVGVELGVEDPAAISPAEARELFLAVTPMPDDLRDRVAEAISLRGLAPERLCYALMTGTWSPVELDFLLAGSGRVASIIAGGAPWTDRSARQAETEACRAALLSGMLFNRFNNRDQAGTSGAVRVLEDDRLGVRWSCLPDEGAVRFSNLDVTAPLPWLRGRTMPGGEELTVVPRGTFGTGTAETLERLAVYGAVALLLPLDVAEPQVPEGVMVLRCPDRLADLDKAIEAKLLTARISRG
ncbi:hypothetical protein ACFPIJ_56905 [Dactylosporangium cerinum]|uniref:YcaO domain-containing protein n=1 Tax=Dactylosporangium cerinum TaxID=1434730 RepID=A0ABV9WJT5_9ACTN